MTPIVVLYSVAQIHGAVLIPGILYFFVPALQFMDIINLFLLILFYQ